MSARLLLVRASLDMRSLNVLFLTMKLCNLHVSVVALITTSFLLLPLYSCSAHWQHSVKLVQKLGSKVIHREQKDRAVSANDYKFTLNPLLSSERIILISVHEC